MDEAQLQTKLKQMKRQKEQAEEELESANEKWRSERRRLHTEIDRLESTLADAKAKAVKRGTGDTKALGMDAAGVARMQEAADEKLKKAAKEWEAERARLKTQINRLEGAVAEAIERSANPMRATQSVKEQFEAELDRVASKKTDVEQAFLRAKTEWEQEKLKMTGEMVKLRRAAQMMGVPVLREDAPEVNPKVRELKDQLEESLAKWNAEREKLVTEIQMLEAAARQWDTERRQLSDHAGQLQQAFVQAQARIQGLEVAGRSSAQSETRIEELKLQNEALDREFQDARNDWEDERRRLSSEIESRDQELEMASKRTEGVSSEVIGRLRKQYEHELQDAIQQKAQLSLELQRANALLEDERARLTAEISKLRSDRGKGESAGGLSEDAIAAEVSRVEAKIQQLIALIDDPETELSTVIRKNVEKAELDAYVKGILFSLGRSKGL